MSRTNDSDALEIKERVEKSINKVSLISIYNRLKCKVFENFSGKSLPKLFLENLEKVFQNLQKVFQNFLSFAEKVFQNFSGKLRKSFLKLFLENLGKVSKTFLEKLQKVFHNFSQNFSKFSK